MPNQKQISLKITLRHFNKIRRNTTDCLFVLFILLALLVETSIVDFCIASGQKKYGFQLSQRDKAFGIYFNDIKRGWIVGDNGLAMQTRDGGESWQRVKISDGTLNDIFFIEEKGWIVGGGEMILHTDDGGKKWKRQRGSAPQPPAKFEIPMDGTCPDVANPLKSLMKVFFMDKEKGFSVGADGAILRSPEKVFYG